MAKSATCGGLQSAISLPRPPLITPTLHLLHASVSATLALGKVVASSSGIRSAAASSASVASSLLLMLVKTHQHPFLSRRSSRGSLSCLSRQFYPEDTTLRMCRYGLQVARLAIDKHVTIASPLIDQSFRSDTLL